MSSRTGKTQIDSRSADWTSSKDARPDRSEARHEFRRSVRRSRERELWNCSNIQRITPSGCGTPSGPPRRSTTPASLLYWSVSHSGRRETTWGSGARVARHSTNHESAQRTANGIQQATEGTERTEKMPHGSRSIALAPSRLPSTPKPFFFVVVVAPLCVLCVLCGLFKCCSPVFSVFSVACSSRSLCSLCLLWLVLAFQRSRRGKERCPRGRGHVAGHWESDSHVERSNGCWSSSKALARAAPAFHEEPEVRERPDGTGRTDDAFPALRRCPSRPPRPYLIPRPSVSILVPVARRTASPPGR
jgi:hypothetical protein